MNRLIRLYEEFDQSPWLDNLRRGYLTSGQLAELRDDGIRGLTSNPTIFQKAIEGAADYDEQFRTLALDEHPTIADYWAMVLQDIAGAADVLEPVYDESGGADGFVSVEVDPGLAHDEAGTEAAARELHERIARRNVMVKIPATAEGIAPIRTMIAEGRNTNVTLIFSLDRYREVIDAYLDGLEAFAAQDGTELGTVASVASFFISRVDTEVDRRLEQIGTPEALALRGKAAIAQGKLAYKLFTEMFSGERWEALADAGRQGAAPAVGEHVDEERGLPRHDVRRQPDRPVHRQHDARRHDRGVQRPRHPRPHGRPRRRRGRGGLAVARRRRRRSRRRRRPTRTRRRGQLPEELLQPDRRPRRQGRRTPRRVTPSSFWAAFDPFPDPGGLRSGFGRFGRPERSQRRRPPGFPVHVATIGATVCGHAPGVVQRREPVRPRQGAEHDDVGGRAAAARRLRAVQPHRPTSLLPPGRQASDARRPRDADGASPGRAATAG